MTNFNQLIEYFQQGFFNYWYSIFVEENSILFHHFINEESVFELIVNRIISFIFNDHFDWSQSFISKVQQEIFVFLNSSVNEFSDNVAEKSCIGFAELFDVELITVKRLNLFIIFLSNYLAKLMKEYILGLIYVVSLSFNEISNRHPWCSLLRKVQ